MPRPIARLNDRTTGTCRVNGPQGGTITTASSDLKINNRGIARLNDQVTADCGHVSYIISASTNTKVNDRGVARLNDRVGNGDYEAEIVTGSSDTLIN